jgi:hypothetical protein
MSILLMLLKANKEVYNFIYCTRKLRENRYSRGKKETEKRRTVGETHVQDECSTSGLRYDCGINEKDWMPLTSMGLRCGINELAIGSVHDLNSAPEGKRRLRLERDVGWISNSLLAEASFLIHVSATQTLMLSLENTRNSLCNEQET